MSTRRLQARTPSAEVIGPAVLEGYRLVFHKISLDGSGKCDVVASVSHSVCGVLYRIERREKALLDELEMAGFGYRDHAVTLRLAGDTLARASTYVAARVDPLLRPYTWYKRHVVVGAEEAGLPQAYISEIKTVSAVSDPDRQREARELAIYR